jgi:hypothetical protein
LQRQIRAGGSATIFETYRKVGYAFFVGLGWDNQKRSFYGCWGSLTQWDRTKYSQYSVSNDYCPILQNNERSPVAYSFQLSNNPFAPSYYAWAVYIGN